MTTTQVLPTPHYPPAKARDSISILELKTKCKELKIRGYSKKKKKQIVDLLISNGNKDDPEIRRISLLAKTVKQLKKMCKQLEIKGYSKKKKNDLVQIIHDTEMSNKLLSEKLHCLCDKYNIQQDYEIEGIIAVCHKRLSKHDSSCTIEHVLQIFKDYHKDIEKDIICKAIRRYKKDQKELEECATNGEECAKTDKEASAAQN